MAAINTVELAGSAVHQIVKREKNWAQREAGVVVVFAIVFIVAIGLIALCVHKQLQKRKAAKAGAY